MATVEVEGDYFGYEVNYDAAAGTIKVILYERGRIERILEENSELRSRNMELEECLDDARSAAKEILRVTEEKIPDA